MNQDGSIGTGRSAAPHPGLRWAFLGTGAGIVASGKFLGLVRASSAVLIATIAVLAILNWLLNRRLDPDGGPNRSWQVTFAAYDLLAAALLTFFLGPGAAALAVLVSIVPHSFDSSIRARPVVPPVAAAVYLVAVAGHRLAFDPPWWRIPASAFLETALLLGVAWLLTYRYSQLRKSIHALSATAGVGEVVSDTVASLGAMHGLALFEGWLADSVRSLDSAVADLRQAAQEGDQLANAISAHTQRSEALGRELAPLASELARVLQEQQSLIGEHHRRAADALGDWDRLKVHAKATMAHLEQLVDHLSCERERASTSLRTLQEARGNLAQATRASQAVADASRKADSAAQRILKISRHTHVLALNAAIEAAHAGEHGTGFSVVAEQVRLLASDARTGARDVAERATEIHDAVETFAADIEAGSSVLDDLLTAIDGTRTALTKLIDGARQLRDDSAEAGALSATQSQQMGSLPVSLRALASHIEGWSQSAHSLSTALGQHSTEAAHVGDAGRAVGALGNRLRAAADRLASTRAPVNQDNG